MSTKVDVSIIVPTYQRPDALKRCLESIQEAKTEDIEVIVVDDGSVPPIEIQSTFSFPIQLIRQANLGAGQARNRGAKVAKGKILLFLDDDCCLEKGAITSCVQLLNETTDNIVLGAQILGTEKDNLLERFKNARSRIKSNAELSEALRAPGCAFALKRELFESVGGFDPAFYAQEDCDLWLRLKKRGVRLLRLKQFTVKHYVSINSVFDFLAKAAFWAGEDEDLLMQQHGTRFGPGGYRITSMYEKFSRYPARLSNMIYLPLIVLLLPLRSFYWTVRRFNAPIPNEIGRFSFVALSLLWDAGEFLGILRKLLRILGSQISDTLGIWGSLIEINLIERLKRGPREVILFVTNACQADCAHCFYFDKLNTKVDLLSLEDYVKLSQNMGSIYKLYLSGGEPFLHNDLPTLVQIFYRRNRLRVLSIPTNGYIPDRIERTVIEIARRCPRLKINVNVSIDGPEALHNKIRKLSDGYNRALQTVEMLRGLRKKIARLTVSINSTLMPENRELFYDFLNSFNDARAGNIKINADVAYPRIASGISNNRSEGIALSDSEYSKFEPWLGGVFPKLILNPLKFLSRVIFQSKQQALFALAVRAQREGKQPIPCRAADYFLVVRENGDVAHCEQRNYIGNLKDQSLQQIRSSKRAVDDKQEIERGSCACSHCLFQDLSILTKPWHKASRRLLWNGLIRIWENRC